MRPDQVLRERLLDIDHHDREAVAAVVDGEIIGVARYFRRPGAHEAELVVVADDWHGQGLAIRMLSSLARLAQSAGVKRFTASIQADNGPALALLRRIHPSGVTFSQGRYESTLVVEEGTRLR